MRKKEKNMIVKELIKDFQSSFNSYNKGLTKRNLLIDTPWTLLDGNLDIHKLIFKKENILYIIEDSEIKESKWEYLTELNSLVIEVFEKKIILNEIYLDGNALILKVNGKNQDYLCFINEKSIPDGNLIEYFNNKFNKPEKAIEYEEKENKVDKVLDYIYRILFFLGICAIIFVILKIIISSFS